MPYENRLDLGKIFTDPFSDFNVTKVINCCVPEYNGGPWPINYPNVDWNDTDLVIMHFQDFVSIREGRCLELDLVESHFKDRAERIVVVHWTMGLEKIYHGPMHLLYFPWHGYNWMYELFREYDALSWQKRLLDTERSHNWQCLNGIPRRHRKLTALYLQENFSNGVLSLGTKIPLPEWDYSMYGENHDNWIRLLPIYSSCRTNIVTETQYYETPGIITEKTLMAFLSLQIPIIIGYKGIVQDCENLGFDMFTDIIDVSYDNDPDEVRWKNAIDLNSDVINGKYNWDLLIPRLIKNQTYLLEVYPEEMIKRFNNNAQDILERLRR